MVRIIFVGELQTWQEYLLISTASQCNLGDIDANITTDTEAQCLKCADFSVWFGDSAEDSQSAVNGMMGPAIPGRKVRNIFDVCNDVNLSRICYITY